MLSLTRPEAPPPCPAPLLPEAAAQVRLAAPAIASGLGFLAMGLTDTLMVGRLGPAALGAVGLANGVYFTTTVMIFGLADAAVPLIARARGAGEDAQAGAWMAQALWLAVPLSLPLAAIFLDPSWAFAALDQPPEVARLAGAYLSARCPGLLAQAGYACHRAFLQGVADTAAVGRLAVVAAVANLVGNAALMFGLGPLPAMGVRGAGLASALTSTLLMVLAIRAARHPDHARYRPELAPPDPARLRELARLGIPTGLTYTAEVGGFSAIGVMAGWLGTAALGAHQVALSACHLAWVMAEGFVTAGSVRVGEKLGAEDGPGARLAGLVALGLSWATTLLPGLVFVLAPAWLASAYTDDPAVLALCAVALPVAAPLVMVDALQMVSCACLRATKDARTPLVAHLTGYWVVGIPLGYLLAFPGEWGIRGIWWGLTAALGAVALVATTFFWRRAGVPEDDEATPEP